MNYPLSFKDPTGLEPESEKGGEDRMLTNAVQDLLEEGLAVQNAMQAMFAEMRALMSWNIFCGEYGIDVYTGQMWSNLYYAGGGGSGGARTGDASTGKDDAENGQQGKSVEEDRNKEKTSKTDNRNKTKTKIPTVINNSDKKVWAISEDGNQVYEIEAGGSIYKMVDGIITHFSKNQIYKIVGKENWGLFNFTIYGTAIVSPNGDVTPFFKYKQNGIIGTAVLELFQLMRGGWTDIFGHPDKYRRKR